MIYRLYIDAEDNIVSTRKIKLLGVSKEIRAEVKYLLIKEFTIRVAVERILSTVAHRDDWFYQAQNLRVVAFNGSMMKHVLPALYARSDLKSLQLMLRSRPVKIDASTKYRKMQNLKKEFKNLESGSLPEDTKVGWAGQSIFFKSEEYRVALKELEEWKPRNGRKAVR